MLLKTNYSFKIDKKIFFGWFNLNLSYKLTRNCFQIFKIDVLKRVSFQGYLFYFFFVFCFSKL